MTARCDQCRGRLYPVDVMTGHTVCVECARRALERATSTAAPDEWSVFIAALSSAAVGGEVHQRDVRPKLRGRVKPQHVGKCYSRAIREGLITEVRRERSNDTVGRNTNKYEPVYRLERAA